MHYLSAYLWTCKSNQKFYIKFMVKCKVNNKYKLLMNSVECLDYYSVLIDNFFLNYKEFYTYMQKWK